MEGAMGFVDAIKSGFSNYVNFSGRASRSEYWFWILFYIIVLVVASVLDGVLGTGLFAPIASLGLFLPGLAVSVRRLHDLDKSGWFILIGLIPLVGFIILIVWYCTKGTPGPNRFGPDPLGGM
jgi:uncharacterized membrane protein YhaH (DUF805 family)